MKAEHPTDVPQELVPLSESDLWQRQRAFYEKEGIDAWHGKVPFYATSNPYIANSYANIVVSYMHDVAARSEGKPKAPFHILELGAGSGNFGFYFVRRLDALLKAQAQPGFDFVYVMTDCAESNLEFWRTHPAWQGFIRAGQMDFARFTLGEDSELRLVNAGRTVSVKGGHTPLIILANYVFDTTATDLFLVESGKLKEGRVKRSPDFQAQFSGNHAVTFGEIDSPVQYEEAAIPYYDDPALDGMLRQYVESGQDCYFSVPIAGLTGIRALMEIAGGRMLLIASDKGFGRHYELFGAFEPELAFHDSAFSMMVNFHAVGEYFRQRGGDVLHQITQQGLATSVFVAGDSLDRLPCTGQDADTYLNTFSPGDLFNVYSHLADTKLNCSLETLVSYLNMTQWDPQVFNLHLDMILALAKTASLNVLKDLADGLPRIANNFYYMPGGIDTLANLGLVLQEVELYDDAIGYYHASIDYFGESDVVFYNLGLCHFFLGNLETSIDMFEAAIGQNPDYVMARGWLAQVREVVSRQQAAAEAGEAANP